MHGGGGPDPAPDMRPPPSRWPSGGPQTYVRRQPAPMGGPTSVDSNPAQSLLNDATEAPAADIDTDDRPVSGSFASPTVDLLRTGAAEDPSGRTEPGFGARGGSASGHGFGSSVPSPTAASSAPRMRLQKGVLKPFNYKTKLV